MAWPSVVAPSTATRKNLQRYFWAVAFAAMGLSSIRGGGPFVEGMVGTWRGRGNAV